MTTREDRTMSEKPIENVAREALRAIGDAAEGWNDRSPVPVK
jgi:hypothetical protein